MTADDVKQVLLTLAKPDRASFAARYFQAHPDGYGAGDQFLGLSMPQQHDVAKRFGRLTVEETERLLRDAYHECRMTALLIWVRQSRKGGPALRNELMHRYLANRRYVNNWDLVDSSATALVGETLLPGERSLLYELSTEPDVWTQRITLVATLAFIRKKQFADTFALIDTLRSSPHALVQSAIGWMLREIGKRSDETLDEYLHDHVRQLSRTALRGAIHRLAPGRRQHFLTL